MPRAGVLALGAVLAAWSIPTIGGPTGLLMIAVLILMLSVAHSAGRPRLARRLLPAVIGFAVIGLRLVPMMPGQDVGATVALPDERGPWTFVVEVVGSARDGKQTATLAAVGPPSLRVAATLPAYPTVIPGDTVVIEGSVRPPPDSPYGQYLERIGADGTLQAATMTVLPSPDGPARSLEQLRRSAGIALATVLPEPEGGLAAGILIGLRDLVDRDLAAAFTTAGVSHVVAISGWNIAIVAAAVGAFTGRLGRRRRSVVTILAIVAYVVFAGASASVVRAGVMAGVVLLARESGRAGQAATALGWAVALLLLADPALVRDAGLQLSALATGGLIVWATPLTGALDRLGRGHLPRWLTENLGVSLSAQAATLPLILASFGQLSVVAPAVNLVVVPLVAPAMAAGLLAMAAGGLVMAGAPSVIGIVAAVPAWVLLRLLVGIVQVAADLPFASVALAPPTDTLTAVVAAGLIVGLHRRMRGSDRPTHQVPGPMTAPSPIPGRAGTPRAALPAAGRWSRTASLVLVVAVLVTGGVIAARPAGVARITVLDVGQGDAILVEGSSGSRLLIDGGPDPNRLLVALDARLPPWDRRLDAIVLSHPHEDHVAGLARLLDRYEVRQVFEPGTRGPGPGYAAWLERLIRPGAPEHRSLAAGDRLAVDEIEMTVLWPLAGQVPLEPPDGGTGINNVSIVLLGRIGPSRFLLAGDVEEEIDPQLLTEGLPRLDFLKVAHHGSRTATTQAFVDTVRPRVAVASAGAGNPYGHPTRQTIDRLEAAGAQVYRTDRDGSVSVTFGRDGMVVRAEGGRAATAAKAGPDAPDARGEPVRGIPVVATSTRAVGRYLCAIPVASIAPAALPSQPSIGEASRATTVGYHRPDDRAPTRGGGRPPALPGSPTLVRAARTRRGGGGRVPRGPDRGPGDRRGSSSHGIGSAPARRGQGTARRRPGARAPAWRWLRGLAHPARPP